MVRLASYSETGESKLLKMLVEVDGRHLLLCVVLGHGRIIHRLGRDDGEKRERA